MIKYIKLVSSIALTCLVINISALFALQLPAHAQADSKKNIGSIIQENTGFGLIPDPMVFNAESGQYTATEKFRRTKALQESYERGEWTYTEAALDVGSTIYDVAESAYVDLTNPDDEHFNADELTGLYDGIPPMFHKEIYNTGNEVEAWAKRARVESYLYHKSVLRVWSGF